MLIEAMFRQRGIRDQVDLSLFTREPASMLVAGPTVGEALESMLADRGIRHHPQHTVNSVDPDSRTLSLGDQAVQWDLLVGIPPRRAPALVANVGGWSSTAESHENRVLSLCPKGSPGTKMALKITARGCDHQR